MIYVYKDIHMSKIVHNDANAILKIINIYRYL